MLNLAILGSTGSIGTQALDVVRRCRDRYQVVALSAHTDIETLEKQAEEFKPRYVGVTGAVPSGGYFDGAAVLTGGGALAELASLPEVDAVLYATVGFGGVEAVLAGIEAGKRILLANKEALVCGGALIMPALAARGGVLLPVDSEHSAVFQCLEGRNRKEIRRIILTASGGAFRDLAQEALARVTAAEALSHPNWRMGRKITVDCATLVNKGLEVIEAKWLFGVGFDCIECIQHRESVIHSMVEFADGCVLAELSRPTMELPISYALSWPERVPSPLKKLDFAALGKLTFEPLDTKRFPCFDIVVEAGRRGGLAPTAVSGANEVLVEAFLGGSIPFLRIPEVLEEVLHRFTVPDAVTLTSICEADAEARRLAFSRIR